MIDFLVIGAGVIGLTNAVELQRRKPDSRVAVWADRFSPKTTSDSAAAVWFPFQSARDARTPDWIKQTLDVYYEEAENPESGVFILPGIEVYHEPVHNPWWRECVRVFRQADADELPEGFHFGVVLEAPVVEPHRYLSYLMAQCNSMGIELKQKKLSTLEEAFAACPMVINASGLGAKELCNDSSLYPVQGQVVSTTRHGANRFCFDQTTSPPSYIIPRSQDCILGGTTIRNEWGLEPSNELAADILTRCTRLEPALAAACIAKTWVGLRPGRSSVRLELEHIGTTKRLLHNYGHGGSGFTLAWGCARSAVDLILAE